MIGALYQSLDALSLPQRPGVAGTPAAPGLTVTSGLHLWANDESTRWADLERTIPGTDGGYTLAWDDVRDNGRYLAPNQSNRGSTHLTDLITGKMMADMPGGEQCFGMWPGGVNANDSSVFCVCYLTASRYLGSITGSDAGDGFNLTADGTINRERIEAWVPGTAAVPNNRPYLVSATASSSANLVASYINNSLVGSRETRSWLGYQLIGAIIFNGNSSYQGRFGEILVYNRAVTDTERNSISGYLMQKWSIT